jgi:antitoxin VapB
LLIRPAREGWFGSAKLIVAKRLIRAQRSRPRSAREAGLALTASTDQARRRGSCRRRALSSEGLLGICDNIRVTMEHAMRRVSVFRHKRNQAIRLPKDFDFPGVTELTIEKCGDAILLRPVRPSWTSMIDEPRADDDFLRDRTDVFEDGRLSLNDDDAGPL